jgi:hypothetical protein
VLELQRLGFGAFLTPSLINYCNAMDSIAVNGPDCEDVQNRKQPSGLHLTLLRNFAFYLMLSSLLILETASKIAHLGGAIILISSICLFLWASLQLARQRGSLSRTGKRLSFGLNLGYLLFLVFCALFLAVHRQSIEYWLQLACFLMGFLILMGVWAGNRREPASLRSENDSSPAGLH